MHQPLDQVTQVERDDHSMTVDGQNSGFTVSKLLSKKHRMNKENELPSTSRVTRLTQPPLDRQIFKI